ncbi:MAG: hypothetical protein ACI9Z3_000948, partial [Roseivirga sp.]
TIHSNLGALLISHSFYFLFDKEIYLAKSLF